MKKSLALLAIAAVLAPLTPVRAQTHFREEVSGYQIGRTASEHFSLWGVWPPVPQQSSTNDLLQSLEAIGILSSGTVATPLNLNGGTLQVGAIVVGGTGYGGLFATPTLVNPTETSGTYANPVVTGTLTFGNMVFLTGTASPIGAAVVAAPGVHMLVNTGTSAAEYIKLSGTGSTGWGVVLTGTGP